MNQARYLISVITEQGVLKKILSTWVHLMGSHHLRPIKPLKCLKPEHVLLFCTQETMSQNQPCFLLKHKNLYVYD